MIDPAIIARKPMQLTFGEGKRTITPRLHTAPLTAIQKKINENDSCLAGQFYMSINTIQRTTRFSGDRTHFNCSRSHDDNLNEIFIGILTDF